MAKFVSRRCFTEKELTQAFSIGLRRDHPRSVWHVRREISALCYSTMDAHAQELEAEEQLPFW